MRSGKYSAELINTICERLAGGEPLAVICREDGMPSVTTMWAWSREIPGVAESIARALSLYAKAHIYIYIFLFRNYFKAKHSKGYTRQQRVPPLCGRFDTLL